MLDWGRAMACLRRALGVGAVSEEEESALDSRTGRKKKSSDAAMQRI